MTTKLIGTLLTAALCVGVTASAQIATTTVNLSNTTLYSGVDRLGITVGGARNYGNQQLYRDLFYTSGGRMNGQYWGNSFGCNTGGTNDTTHWYNAQTGSGGYAANWFQGAYYAAYQGSTGNLLGTGTITASTANTGSSGIQFTLSTALSAACSAVASGSGYNDVLVVRTTSPATIQTPAAFFSGLATGTITGAATWGTDVDPTSSNSQQSLVLPTGGSLVLYADPLYSNGTNPNSTLASQQVNWITVNGSYTQQLHAKCLNSSTACSLTYSVARGNNNFVGPTTVAPTYSATSGAGWTTYSNSVTASETGNETANPILYTISCTAGPCDVQDAIFQEGSTLSGNTTKYRDAVVSEFQHLHPGSLRFMDPGAWPTTINDMTQLLLGNVRFGADSNTLSNQFYPEIGYNDALSLCEVVGTDCYINVGNLTVPTEWASLITWLSTQGYTSAFAASGHRIWLVYCNECWNSNPGATLYEGNGTVYGGLLGANIQAAKAASGYNSSVVKLCGNNWNSGNQNYGNYGWAANTLSHAKAVSGSNNTLPDCVDNATYTLSYLADYTISGSDLSIGNIEPWTGMNAELDNLYTVTSPSSGAQSINESLQWMTANYPSIISGVYETNMGTIAGGFTLTQQMINDATTSVASAQDVIGGMLLGQQEGLLSPEHFFVLAENRNAFSGGTGSPVFPGWGCNRYMAAGLGNLSTYPNVDRSQCILLGLVNNAIGNNNNIVRITQNSPTYSYAGGQSGNGYSILANAAVNYSRNFVYNSGTNWTFISQCWDQTTSCPVTITGAGAPTGSVTKWVYPASGETIITNNEAAYKGASSLGPYDVAPSSTSTSGTSYTVPAGSTMILTYSTGSSTTGTVTMSGTVTMTGTVAVH